jgi:hypothetical protein
MQNPKFNLEIQNVIISKKKNPFDFQTLKHDSQRLPYFKIDLEKKLEVWTSKE